MLAKDAEQLTINYHHDYINGVIKEIKLTANNGSLAVALNIANGVKAEVAARVLRNLGYHCTFENNVFRISW